MDKGESIFLREYLVSKAKQTMPISSVCNINCIFCSNNHNPFRITRGVFRDIEDIKANIPLLKPLNNVINISENIPGRIAEGESLLHPRLFEILDLIRERFPYKEIIEVSTNGTALTEKMIKRLYAYMPIKINSLSLNACQINHWLKICRGTPEQARIAIEAPQLFKKYGLPFCGSLVALPEIMGWKGIEKTIGYLAENNARQITLWHPGYSKRTAQAIKKKMDCCFKELSNFAIQMRQRYRKSIRVWPDLNMPLKFDALEIMERTELMRKSNVLWLVSEAAKTKIKSKITESQKFVCNRHFVVPVKNYTYGGNIVVSGLLMVNDFMSTAESFIKYHPEIDLILLPQEPFDTTGRDLIYNHYRKIEERLGRQVMPQ